MRIRYSTDENGKLIKKAVVYTQDEHGINAADVDRDAAGIVQKLKAAGFETYIVGGAVRDLILGKKPKDFDIVSEANPTRIKKIFRNSRIIGRRFRLVHVYFGPRIFEVSTFRSLKDGHTSNTFGTIEDDVLRRDFTLNALFYDPGQQVVVDYLGGMKDIKEKKIKPIIPLAVIFSDDPVRMIRAVKYAAATGFTLSAPLKWKIKKQSQLLSSVSPSRLTEEIFKIINSPKPSEIVEALDRMGLYAYLQPNAARMMRESSGFRSRYLRSLSALGKEKAKTQPQPGETLGTLFFDYLEDIVDWEQGIAENYKSTFAAARSFVLPMNPPRYELGFAVRHFFAAHGVTIKRSHIIEHPPAREKTTGSSPARAVRSKHAADAHPVEAKPHKRRRRKKKKVESEG